MTEAGAPLLAVEDLSVAYRAKGRHRRSGNVVHDVNFSIAKGETLGIVGESGSGKSTIARAILGLVPASGGHVRLDGRDITHANHRERRKVAADLSVVFQDPYSSLNPALTIGTILGEPLIAQKLGRSQARDRIAGLLDEVGLPADALDRFPRQFSGGQRQRIAIARALAVGPRLIVCDEPVSALDVSIQAQIVNLLADIRDEFGLAMLFVAHDLSVVRHVADRTAVVLGGRIMEIGPAEQIYADPRHPYSAALSAAALVPVPHVQRQRREARGALSRINDAAEVGAGGCPFWARCPERISLCRSVVPPMVQITPETSVACHVRAPASPPAPATGHPAAGGDGATAAEERNKQ